MAYIPPKEWERLLKKVLREEVPWRVGIKWFVGSDRRTAYVEGKRGSAPFILVDFVGRAIRLPNGNTLLSDGWAHQVLEVTPDWEVVWEFGEFMVSGVDLKHLNLGPDPAAGWLDYDEAGDTVLISDLLNNRILEVPRGAQEATRSLSASASGAFGSPTAVYNPYTGRIIVCNRDYHYVCEVDWAGTEYWSYGAYGVPGDAIGRLRTPHTANIADMAADVTPRYSVMIADKGNNRVLDLNPETGALRRLHITGLMPVSMTWDSRTQRFCIACEMDVGLVVESYDGIDWCSWWLGAYFGHITPDFTLLTNNEGDVWELDLRSQLGRPATLPIVERALTGHSLGAGESVTVPFYAFGYDRVVVGAKSSEDATLEILTLMTKGDMPTENEDETWPPAWETYDSVALSAGVFRPYVITAPHGVMGAKITMGTVAGTVDLIVYREVAK